MKPTTIVDQMRALGIRQEGDPILREVCTPFDLPSEADEARRVAQLLKEHAARVSAVHVFKKGIGLAAPQIGIPRSAAIVWFPETEPILLLNPKIISESGDLDEQYEGCLSFFDVRGLVTRSLAIQIETTDFLGVRSIRAWHRGEARLVAHEVDHLGGHLYLDRMAPGKTPIPI
ncbi:MAG TPA: peptide deformylase, partial [Candidatus Dormibacteraeota bacterium]|nr:peptide deformylase [Candidatus Dormibacteraeota bacterium]